MNFRSVNGQTAAIADLHFTLYSTEAKNGRLSFLRLPCKHLALLTCGLLFYNPVWTIEVCFQHNQPTVRLANDIVPL